MSESHAIGRPVRRVLSIDGGDKEAVFALTAGITLLIAWFQFSAIPALIGIIGGPVAILLGVVVEFRVEIGQFFVDIGN